MSSGVMECRTASHASGRPLSPVAVVCPITLTTESFMSATGRKLFVNSRVTDLEQAKRFSGALGCTCNPQLTDENAACMIISDEASFMLLTDGFLRRFTDRVPSDVTAVTEAMDALSEDSRAEVDRLTEAARSAGATTAMPPQDHGFMYGTGFRSPDGHHHEVSWMHPGHDPVAPAVRLPGPSPGA